MRSNWKRLGSHRTLKLREQPGRRKLLPPSLTEVSRVHSSFAGNEGTNMNEIRRSDEQLKLINEPGQGR
jgi:hypothetical protein